MLNFSTLTKIASVLSLGKGIIDKTVFQRLLTGIAAVAGLSVVVGMLVGTLLLGALYGIYLALVELGNVNPNLAAFGVALIIAVIAGFLIYKIRDAIKKIATFSSILSAVEEPAHPISVVQSVAMAFINGWKGKQVPAQTKNKNNIKRIK